MEQTWLGCRSPRVKVCNVLIHSFRSFGCVELENIPTAANGKMVSFFKRRQRWWIAEQVQTACELDVSHDFGIFWFVTFHISHLGSKLLNKKNVRFTWNMMKWWTQFDGTYRLQAHYDTLVQESLAFEEIKQDFGVKCVFSCTVFVVFNCLIYTSCNGVLFWKFHWRHLVAPFTTFFFFSRFSFVGGME